MLVGVIHTFLHKFLDNVREVVGQCFVHFAPGIFRRHVAQHAHQAVDSDEVPVVEFGVVLKILFHQAQLQFRIIDERAQFFLLAWSEGIVEDFTHFPLDGAAGIAQHMLKSLVFAMQVSQEMFGTFGQIQDSFKIDDLSTCRSNVREIARHQREISELNIIVVFHRYKLKMLVDN